MKTSVLGYILSVLLLGISAWAGPAFADGFVSESSLKGVCSALAKGTVTTAGNEIVRDCVLIHKEEQTGLLIAYHSLIMTRDGATDKVNIIFGPGTAEELNLQGKVLGIVDPFVIIQVVSEELPEPVSFKTATTLSKGTRLISVSYQPDQGALQSFKSFPEIYVKEHAVSSFYLSREKMPDIRLQPRAGRGIIAKPQGDAVGFSGLFTEPFIQPVLNPRFSSIKVEPIEFKRKTTTFRITISIFDLLGQIGQVKGLSAPGTFKAGVGSVFLKGSTYRTTYYPISFKKGKKRVRTKKHLLKSDGTRIETEIEFVTTREQNQAYTLQVTGKLKSGEEFHSKEIIIRLSDIPPKPKPAMTIPAFGPKWPDNVIAVLREPDIDFQSVSLPPSVLPVMGDTAKVITAPGPIRDCQPARCGWMLALHIPEQGKVAFFDAAKAVMAFELPMPGADTLYAVGADTMVTYTPLKQEFQLWNLENRQCMVTRKAPFPVRHMALGAGLRGPLLVLTPDTKPGTLKPQFIGLPDFKVLPVSALPITGNLGSRKLITIAASASGLVYNLGGYEDRSGTSHKGVKAYNGFFVTGNALKSMRLSSDSPFTADGYGKAVYSENLCIAPETYNAPRTPKTPGRFVPAPCGNLFVSARRLSGPEKDGPATFVFTYYPLNHPEMPLLAETMPKEAGELIPGVFTEPFSLPLQKRIFLLPQANMLVIIPAENNRLYLHPLNLTKKLDAFGLDYLYVISVPALKAVRGQTYTYRIETESSRQGLKYKLAEGPAGMTLSADGTVNWTPPADLGDAAADVSIEITDARNRPIRHEFTLRLAKE